MEDKFFTGDLVKQGEEVYFVNVTQEDKTLILTKRFHPAYTLSYLGVPKGRHDTIKVIRRGNWFRKINNLPLDPFCNLEEEAFFFYRFGEAKLATAEPIEDNRSFANLIEYIRKGEFDGFFTVVQIMESFQSTSFFPIKFNDRGQGRRHAEKVLQIYIR